MENILVEQEIENFDGAEHCVFCGRPVPEGMEVCPICRAQLFNADSTEYSE